MQSKNPNAKLHIMDFRMNVIRQLLESHAALREEAAVVPRPVGGAKQPLRLSGRHFPRPLPSRENGRKKLKRCFVCSNTTRQERKRKETAFECSTCEVALCVYPCFENYHILQNF